MVLRRPASILVPTGLLLLLVLAFLPVPSSGFHAFIMPVPNEGMAVEFERPEESALRVTFADAGERLSGHHEWRRVATATLHQEHDNQTWPGESWLLDMETGLLLGDGTSVESEFAFLGLSDALTYGYAFDSMYSDGIGMHGLLPESLLWGREIWPGSTWEVPTTDRYCDGATTHVAIDGDWSGWWTYENVSAQVVRACTTPQFEWEITWDLFFGDGADAPVAASRHYGFTYTYQYGDTTFNESGGGYQNATVVEEGGAPLPFEGRSHDAFWAARDQTLAYAPWTELFPHDPDPHHLFDIGEAGRIALDTSDEEVRLFLSQASSVSLEAARMTPSSSEVHWSFCFTDDDGTALYVDLYGVKAAGAPLVVWDRASERVAGHGPEDTDPTQEVAHPGDLARLSDQVFEHAGLTPTAYEWSAYGHGTWYHASYAGGLVQMEEAYGWVASDAATAIVADHDHVWYGLRLHPERL